MYKKIINAIDMMQKKKYVLMLAVALLVQVNCSFGQNQAINGNLNVSGYTYGSKGMGFGTSSSVNTFNGRRWWTAQTDYNYVELAQGSWSGISAFLFNAYTTQNENGLDGGENTKFATPPGAFQSSAGMIKFVGNGGGFTFRLSGTSTGVGTPVVWNTVMALQRDSRALFYGNVGIGVTNPSEKLAVNGNIRAKEIKVETANWPDYVFEENYRLPSLADLESYIKINKHLPNMPDQKQVEAEGVSLGEMNRKLLEKVEELTLHLIEKDKEITSQHRDMENLKDSMRKLENLIMKNENQ